MEYSVQIARQARFFGGDRWVIQMFKRSIHGVVPVPWVVRSDVRPEFYKSFDDAVAAAPEMLDRVRDSDFKKRESEFRKVVSDEW